MSHIATLQIQNGLASSPYSYCTVQRCHRTATVRSHPCTVQWLYGENMGPSIGAIQQREMYGKGAHRTVAVRWTRGTVLRLNANKDDRILPIRPVEADPFVVKTLRTVLCSSHDGVPLKWKKENGRPGSLKIYIDWDHFRPLLAVTPLKLQHTSIKISPFKKLSPGFQQDLHQRIKKKSAKNRYSYMIIVYVCTSLLKFSYYMKLKRFSKNYWHRFDENLVTTQATYVRFRTGRTIGW